MQGSVPPIRLGTTGVMALHLPILGYKSALGGTGNEMRTQYLPAQLADDIATSPKRRKQKCFI